MSGTMVYAWKAFGLHRVCAAVAGREIERVRIEHADSFVADDVVEAARPEDAPPHPEFEWDDGVAAQA
jgi:hypothetical protein